MMQEVRRDAEHDTLPHWALQPRSSFVPTRTGAKAPPNAAPPNVAPRVKRRTPIEPLDVRPSEGRFLPAFVMFFAVLNAADLFTTFVGLHNGLHEGNPLMGALLANYGFTALVIYKAIVIVAVALGVRMLRSFRVSVANVTIVLCDLLVLVVVIANVTQYLATA